MEAYLAFRLSAALGSMGDNIGNDRRGTDRWPARSAITGLIGGALGIDRSDRRRLQALETDYAIAVARPDSSHECSLLVDYHTTQYVPSTAVKRPDSRREALVDGLARGKVGTSLSTREYIENPVFDIVVCSRGSAHWELNQLGDALVQPYFVPYFGRKACPLDSPLFPVVVEADSVVAALAEYRRVRPEIDGESAPSEGFTIRADCGMVGVLQTGARRISRRDGVTDRTRWLFNDRQVDEFRVSAETVE
jgi:CRISPR system Cascade subunit CasD